MNQVVQIIKAWQVKCFCGYLILAKSHQELRTRLILHQAHHEDLNT